MSTLVSLFKYKAWINEQLFAAVARIDPATHQAERHTATRILNHVYVVDRIFTAHLTGSSHSYSATNTQETPTLEVLASAVAASDAWFVDYARSVTPAQLAEPVAFRFTDGDGGGMTREEMLLHVSTHGAYHRGAVGRILTQCSMQPPRDTFTTYLHATEPARREEATAAEGAD